MPIPCDSCDSGSLEKKKGYRLNGCLVTIGYLLMVPALLLVLILVLQLLMAAGQDPQDAPNPVDRAAGIQARLEAVYVPEEMIEKVMTDGFLEEEEMAVLTPEQLKALHEAQFAMALSGLGELGVYLAARIARIFVFLLIASMVGALLGWFLVRRTRVLRCNRCGTIHPDPHPPLLD